MSSPRLQLDFSTAPTVYTMLQDDAFVRGLMGPVGSGKSYACAAEIMLRAVKQAPSPRDNVKYSRWVVVRNSYPELRTTTLKTWQELFPEHVWGHLRWSPPITHHIRAPATAEAAGLDCEVIFLALDSPKDVRKLLSLELTGGWINEARELPKAIIDALTHRVGRYPTKVDGGATWRGVFMDTNPPDSDHWWFRLAEVEKMSGPYAWKFFRQAGGLVDVPATEVPTEHPEAQGYCHVGGKWWKTNPEAENLPNLPTGYYEQLALGKHVDWLRVYACGQYGYVQDGRPVWPEYDDDLMVDELDPDPSVPIQVGLDFGLTPAAVFAQRHPTGQWRVLHEIVTSDMGLERFGLLLKAELERRFPKYDVDLWGDPAGAARDQIFEVTSFDHLKTLGLVARPCPTNDFKTRREALAAPMSRLVGGRPGFLVDRSCARLRKSLSGGYHFKRIAVAGHDRFKDSPNKNEHSHVGDAAAYCCLGGGEHRRLVRSPTRMLAPVHASWDWDPLEAAW